MFESLHHISFLFSPVDSHTGRRALVGKRNADGTAEDLSAHIEELKKVNRELREARRAAFNLLEDAQIAQAQLANDLDNTRLLLDVAEKLIAESDVQEHYHHILNAAITITKADAGMIQMLNDEREDLVMVADKGLGQTFINYFTFLNAGPGTPYGIALRKKERIITDFNTPSEHDPDGLVKMHADEGFLSAQSTPLVAHSGRAIGIITTYFRNIHRPGERELDSLDLLVRLAGDMVERKKMEESLRQNADRLREFNSMLEHQVSERTKELTESERRINELNKSLFGRNKELQSLNTELKTFTGIAASDYSEMLRQLYVYMEMIVTHDARSLSNSGRANLRRAQGVVQKMKLATEDLMSFSKLHEIGSRENKVDLNTILKAVVEDFTSQTNSHTVDLQCDVLPFISGYPSLLTQLFHHLIDNAIKLRKEEGGLIINITCKEPVNGGDVDHPSAEKDTRYTVISVKDNGVGFPQSEAERIFEMFHRLHEKGRYKGSGAGLALCKKIMEMHGGFITAEGVPGDGASFHCYFPVAE